MASKSFHERAHAQLKAAIKQFGRYSYSDKGASEIMDLYPLIVELRAMTPEAAAKSLHALSKKENTHILVSELITNMQDWDELFQTSELQHIDW